MRGFHRFDSRPARPRYEPEIIPPAHERAESGVFVFVDRYGHARRFAFRPPGPLAIVIALVLLGVVAAAGLVMLLGFVLLWIPAVIALIVAFAFAGYIRRVSWRWRGRS